MFEPRVFHELLIRKDLRFLGGTPEFDLWAWVGEQELPFALRIHNVRGTPNEWDLFDLPLRDNQPHGRNTELLPNQAPKYRRLRGQWDDVRLTLIQVNEIETYLRCFAPWVLGRGLTEENNNE